MTWIDGLVLGALDPVSRSNTFDAGSPALVPLTTDLLSG